MFYDAKPRGTSASELLRTHQVRVTVSVTCAAAVLALRSLRLSIGHRMLLSTYKTLWYSLYEHLKEV